MNRSEICWKLSQRLIIFLTCVSLKMKMRLFNMVLCRLPCETGSISSTCSWTIGILKNYYKWVNDSKCMMSSEKRLKQIFVSKRYRTENSEKNRGS